MNFAGLPGNSTEEPVHLLNILIEEAASKKQELWLLFQDMKKAFDSVSLIMLKLSLERIKVPSTIIRFIINIFENRKVKVITHFGLTNDFVAVDGIEQGEVLSPLIWRIFYDPLLWRIQNDLSVGYIAKVTKFTWSETDRGKDIRVSVLAYADDTTWIARSKNEIEKIIEMANQFFRINDIEINGKKSKLAVLNMLNTKEDRNVKFGDAIVKAEENMSEIKFLGVYLYTKKELPIIKKKIRKLISLFAHTLEKKQIMVSQLVYINNQVLIPKLEYILQATNFSEKELEDLYQPILRLFKRKLGIARTAPNGLLIHGGMFNCKTLAGALFAKQVTNLFKRLNSVGLVEELTELSIRNGSMYTGLTRDIRVTDPLDNHDKVWRGNLACNIIEKGKGVNIIFKSSTVCDNKFFRRIPIQEILDQQASAKSYNHRRNLEIFSLDQLLNNNNSELITWQQLKKAWSKSAKGKKARWFAEIERQILVNNTSRLVKDKFRLDKKRQQTVRPPLFKHKKDKRNKDWIIFEDQRSEERR